MGTGDWNEAEDGKFKASLDHTLRPIFEEKEYKLRNNYKNGQWKCNNKQKTSLHKTD